MSWSVQSQVVELVHPVGGLEVLWHGVVHARDDLVDRLLPRLLGVLVQTDRLEELTQRRLKTQQQKDVTSHSKVRNILNFTGAALINVWLTLIRHSYDKKTAHDIVVRNGLNFS